MYSIISSSNIFSALFHLHLLVANFDLISLMFLFISYFSLYMCFNFSLCIFYLFFYSIFFSKLSNSNRHLSPVLFALTLMSTFKYCFKIFSISPLISMCLAVNNMFLFLLSSSICPEISSNFSISPKKCLFYYLVTFTCCLQITT